MRRWLVSPPQIEGGASPSPTRWNDALGGDRGSAYSRWDILAGWRVIVWRGPEDAVGEENASGRAEPDSAGGEFVGGADGREDYFGRDGQRNEVGYETTEHLWVCRRRSSCRCAGESGSEARRDR